MLILQAKHLHSNFKLCAAYNDSQTDRWITITDFISAFILFSLFEKELTFYCTCKFENIFQQNMLFENFIIVLGPVNPLTSFCIELYVLT